MFFTSHPSPSFFAMIMKYVPRSMKEIVAVLPNIRSLHNVGSAFRTADAAGVSKLYLSGITPKPVDPLGNYRREIAKVALGAERTVYWGKMRLQNMISMA